MNITSSEGFGNYCWIDTSFFVSYEIVPKESEDETQSNFKNLKKKSLFDGKQEFNPFAPFETVDKEKLKDIDPFAITLGFHFAQTLKRIEDKIDKLINGEKKMPSYSFCEGEGIQLSAEGIIICVKTKVARGDLLHMNLKLPDYPPSIISALGKVIKVLEVQEEEHSLSYTVMLKFDSIFEEDRDVIFQFVTRKQREMIRSSKQEPYSG